MSRKPTNLDIAADLRRCIYASYSKDRFQDKNVSVFLLHALRDLKRAKSTFDKKQYKNIMKCIRKSRQESLPDHKRRENLLTAAILIQSI
jgi:hypothetical protein